MKRIYYRMKTRKMRDVEELISVADYAKKYHLDPSSVRGRIASGKLWATKHARKWWIKESPQPDE